LSQKGGPSKYTTSTNVVAFATSLAKYSRIITIFFDSSNMFEYIKLIV